MPRNRRALLALIAGVLALGFVSRRHVAPDFVQLYVGDVLWGVLFFLLFGLLWPRASSLRLAQLAVATTELTEFSQLYQAPWIRGVRATPLGGLLLGHAFLWSDVLCVFVGATLAAAVDSVVRHRLHAAG